MQKNQINYFRYLNIIAFIVTIIINSLAGSTTFIGGQLTAQVSDANPTLITPAGYVFSIWGIIYLLLVYLQSIKLYREIRTAHSRNKSAFSSF